MSQTSRIARTGVAVLLAFTAVAVLSGCSWFRKGARGDYALAAEQRPLEVPPDLNLPDTSGAMSLPPAGAAQPARPGAAPAPTASGFTVAGTRDEIFAKVGTALEGIDGLAIDRSAVPARRKVHAAHAIQPEPANTIGTPSATDCAHVAGAPSTSACRA